MIRAPTEHEEQRDFVRWFKKRHPTVKIAAIPNGGARNKSVAAKLKAEGVSKGVPDLIIPAWFTWIEMKRIKGSSVSAEQKEWMQYLTQAGYQCFVCKGFKEATIVVSEIEKTKFEVTQVGMGGISGFHDL